MLLCFVSLSSFQGAKYLCGRIFFGGLLQQKIQPFDAFTASAWRRPTLPGPCGPSTIGAEGLNGRVRDGYAWFPFAITTKRMFR